MKRGRQSSSSKKVQRLKLPSRVARSAPPTATTVVRVESEISAPSPAATRAATSGSTGRSRRKTVSSSAATTVPNVAAAALNSGVPVGVNQGDAVGDVIKYWCHLVENPQFLAADLWTVDAGALALPSGAIQIFANFTQFIHHRLVEESQHQRRMQDDGLDLTTQDGVNISDLVPRDDDAPKASEAAAVVAPAKSASPLKVGQNAFWDLTRHLLPCVKKHAQAVDLPARDQLRDCLRRLGQRVHHATQAVQVRLEHVPTAYNDTRWHFLTLLITPDLKKASRVDDCVLSLYNTSDRQGVYDTQSQRHRIRLVDLAKTVHPMFSKPCWRDLVLKVAGLASLKSLFINWNFHVGLHYQYLDVFEQNFELLEQREVEAVDQSMTGAAVTQWKYSLEADDCERGRMPQWYYEFEIPDPNGTVTRHIPTYKGMKVRFMFREDHQTWFF